MAVVRGTFCWTWESLALVSLLLLLRGRLGHLFLPRELRRGRRTESLQGRKVSMRLRRQKIVGNCLEGQICRRTEVDEFEIDGIVALLFAQGREVLVAPARHGFEESITSVGEKELLLYLYVLPRSIRLMGGSVERG